MACGSSTSRHGDLSNFECTWFQCMHAIHTVPYDTHSFMFLNCITTLQSCKESPRCIISLVLLEEDFFSTCICQNGKFRAWQLKNEKGRKYLILSVRGRNPISISSALKAIDSSDFHMVKEKKVFEIGSPTVEPGTTKSPTVDFPFLKMRKKETK